MTKTIVLILIYFSYFASCSKVNNSRNIEDNDYFADLYDVSEKKTLKNIF